MSGGSYDYISFKLDEECSERMCDYEMNDLIKDLIPVLHELEWWQSGDSLEEDYREELKKFKNKWFKQNRNDRLKQYIENEIDKTKKELYELLKEK